MLSASAWVIALRNPAATDSIACSLYLRRPGFVAATEGLRTLRRMRTLGFHRISTKYPLKSVDYCPGEVAGRFRLGKGARRGERRCSQRDLRPPRSSARDSAPMEGKCGPLTKGTANPKMLDGQSRSPETLYWPRKKNYIWPKPLICSATLISSKSSNSATDRWQAPSMTRGARMR